MLRRGGQYFVAIAAAVAAAMAIPSCASILGIEELKPGEDGGSTGTSETSSGGAAGTGGSSSSAGGASSGAAGSSAGGASGGGTSGGVGTTSSSTGSGGSAGASGGTAGSGVTTGGTGGNVVDAGGDRGAGGSSVADASDAKPPVDASDGGATTIVVSGKVIDAWRHPCPNAPVMIGSTVVITDANGAFSIPGVTKPYDVTFIVDTPQFTEAWAFIGLTNDKPTLQFDADLSPTHSETSLTAPVTGISDMSVFSWGSADGIFNEKLSAPGIQDDSPSWSGPTQSAGVAHALKWTTQAGGEPAAYTGYDEKPATLTANGTLSLSLDLTTKSIPTDTVSGTVTLGELTSPLVDVWVTFAGGGGITVVSQAPPQNAFSYLVPRIANATVTLVETAGDSFYFPFGLVHKRAPASSLTGVTLTVPDPAHLALPRDAGMASSATEFSWTGPDVVYVAGFWVVDTGIRYRVVTKEKNGSTFVAHLPRLPPNSGIDFPVGKTVNWWAEFQGTYASVDDATGPQGFVDSIDGYTSSSLQSATIIVGPNDRDGVRVTSAVRSFTSVAP
jgi:hypothetical protein